MTIAITKWKKEINSELIYMYILKNQDLEFININIQMV